MVSSGTSSTEATRYLAKTLLQLGLDEAAGVVERDPVEHVAEESLHDHPLGRLLGNASRAQVEEVLRVDRSDGGAVSAADVVVVDLEHRNRSGFGVVGENEVPVGPVGVRTRRALPHPDQSRVNGACGVLERVEVEELFARCEVDRLQLGVRALPDE